jgi:DNA-binding response OmpR family regulator
MDLLNGTSGLIPIILLTAKESEEARVEGLVSQS